MAGKSYKQEKRKGTVADFVSEAFGEWQSLRHEMREWADSMEEKFSQTSKYETVSGTADTLDNNADNEPEMPDAASGLEVNTVVYVKYGKERGSESRDTRNGNAIALVEASVDAIETEITDLETRADELDSTKLDDAEEEYKSSPSKETGLVWMQVASQYAVDKMITQEEADAVKAKVTTAFPDMEEAEANVNEVRDSISKLEELRDALSEVKDEFEGLEFPSMYG